MNHQVATSIDTNNAGATRHSKLSVPNHQPGGKRKVLATISSNRQENINVPVSNIQAWSKGCLKATDNKGLHVTKEVPLLLQQNPLGRPALRQISEPNKPALGFQIYCDEEQNKENTRPAHNTLYSERTSQKPFLLQSPLKLESPGVQNDKDEEEIFVVDSPMVIDTSIVSENLKKDLENREFLFPEYSQEIYAYLKGVEARLRPRVSYMRKQTDITPGMRRILVDWLVEVCQEYKLDQETLYLAVSYIDRFLSHMAVLRAKLQLVGTACMFIAAKYEEIYPPDVSEFVYITDNTYTKQQVLRMEHLVLKVLAFDLSIPTPNFFLQRLCSLCSVPAPTECLARYLCELCLLEADPFLKYLPSETACAALALANHTMGKEMWSSELQLVTEYIEEDFRECLSSMYTIYLEAATCPQQAIQEKYRSHKYHCVSSITPPPSLPFY